MRSVSTPARLGWFGQMARLGARRDHQTVERDALAVVELHFVRGEIERDRARASSPLEVEVVDALLAQHDLVGFPLAAQQLLRQRRPVVGKVRLGADRDDAPVEALTAQRLGRAQPRE